MKHKKSKKRSKTKRKNRDSSSEGSSNEEKLRKKRRRRYSSTSSSSSEEERRKRKIKKVKKKHKRKSLEESKGNDEECFDVPLSLMNATSTMAPMTKEEWEKKQNVTKRVFDESTGRYRLIKGDGEVVEEIVSKARHQEINKQATRGDGLYFQSQLLSKTK